MSTEPKNIPCIAEGFCFSLYSAAHAMMKAYTPLLKEIGLTYPQYLVLFALWEKDGQTVSDLGDTLFLDSGTLTPLLKRMEKAGLVKRARSSADERVVQVTLTEKGRDLKVTGMEIARGFMCATGRTPEQVAPLRIELNQVRDRLLKTVKKLETGANAKA